MKKRKGCSIIFINDQNEILLFLRDNISEIDYPNMWDVPGGHVEEGETPAQCIVREMREEIGMDLKSFQEFSIREFEDRVEYTYWKNENLDIDKVVLNEGQKLRWFTREEAEKTVLAYGFNRIVNDFYQMIDKNRDK